MIEARIFVLINFPAGLNLLRVRAVPVRAMVAEKGTTAKIS